MPAMKKWSASGTEEASALAGVGAIGINVIGIQSGGSQWMSVILLFSQNLPLIVAVVVGRGRCRLELRLDQARTVGSSLSLSLSLSFFLSVWLTVTVRSTLARK